MVICFLPSKPSTNEPARWVSVRAGWGGSKLIVDTNELHAQYLDLGYSPIPLCPNQKHPLRSGRQRTPTARQWHKAPGDANIGLRAGNGKAFFDCDNDDDPHTFQNLANWLDGLGYHEGSYPVVKSASGIGVMYMFPLPKTCSRTGAFSSQNLERVTSVTVLARLW